jgi:hypothetical protein
LDAFTRSLISIDPGFLSFMPPKRASFDLGQQQLAHMQRSYPFANRVAGNEIGTSRTVAA